MGALIGAAFGGSGATVIAGGVGALFGLVVGLLAGGYGSLESPQPGREPSETERPVADRPQLTSEEHPGPKRPD